MKYIYCAAFGKLISRAFTVMAVSVEALGTVEFIKIKKKLKKNNYNICHLASPNY